MIGNIPDGWRVEKMVNLSKILDGDRGKNYPKQEDFSDNDYCLFLTTKNVSKKGFKFDSTQFISKDKDEILRKGRLERNDLVITTRGTVGNIAFFNQDVPFDIIRINSGMAIIRITAEDLSHSFVNTYFKSNIFYRYVSEIISGSAQPQITITKLKNLTIPIPPIPQQEKIVKVLDISSALIEKQKELIANYDLFLKSKFIEMFGDPINNIHNWNIVNLEEVVIIDAPMVEPNKPEYQDMFHIGPKRIEKHTGKLLPALKVKEENLISKKFLFDESYVLYSKIRPNLNKVAVVNFTGLCSADMYPIKPIEGKLAKLYLWKLLLSKFFLRYTESLPDRANIPKLNRKELAKFSFPLPPIELQNKFARIVEKIETIKSQEAQKLDHLETLHKSLMDKAFKGEIG